MENKAISEIVRFQTDRELHTNEYDSTNEHGNIVEELLESVGLDVPKDNRPTLKERWEEFMCDVTLDGVAENAIDFQDMPTSEQVDAYADICVFAIGAMLKLGYDPEKALLEVGKEINSRTGRIVDGKFEKDLSEEAIAKHYKADYDGQALLD
ncbi:MAG: hypothetical protein HKP62_06985 [Sulfurovum sp.]|nr:hypothetical protein [Sulfurovum sp.]NNJ45743.1 hypothetical protein [Sulfurovum sp.]